MQQSPTIDPNAALRAFKTTDPEIFSEAATRFNNLRTDIRPIHAGPFRADLAAARLTATRMARFRVRNFVVRSPAGGHDLGITIPLESGFHVRESGHTRPYAGTKAYLRMPNREFHLEAEDVVVFVIRLPIELLRETGIRLTGSKTVPPGSWSDELWLIDSAKADFLRAAIALWNDVRRHPPLFPTSAALQEREAALMENFLLATSLRDCPAMATDRSRASRSGLARAEEWIDAHLGEAITRADLCAVSGLNARTLTRAFEHRHGLSPIAFARARRLDAVHRRLLAATPGETSVGEIALRHGFTQLGRFAADYHRAFGELPSATLRS